MSEASRAADPSPAGPGPHTDRRLLLLGVAALVSTAAAVAMIALAIGAGRPGWPRAVAFAAATCLPGSLAAWIVARLPTPIPARAVAASLAAIALRIIPPLVGLAWLSSGGQGSFPAEIGGLLVVFYLALLATDLLLHMMASGRSHRRPKPPD